MSFTVPYDGMVELIFIATNPQALIYRAGAKMLTVDTTVPWEEDWSPGPVEIAGGMR